MPKMTERERLVELETRQRRIADEIEAARLKLRSRYAAIVSDLPIETVSERDFRDILTQCLRVGGAASIVALKALPAIASPTS